MRSRPRATYTFLIDPWNDEYVVQKSDPVSQTAIDLESGEAAALLPPPRPNVLSLACVARAESTFLSLRANGKLVTSLMYVIGGRLDRIGLTAWSPEGGQKVVFDAVVVETGKALASVAMHQRTARRHDDARPPWVGCSANAP